MVVHNAPDVAMPLPKGYLRLTLRHAQLFLDGEVFFTGGAAGGYGILVPTVRYCAGNMFWGLLNSKLLDWIVI